MGSGHDHAHVSRSGNRRRLTWALLISAGVLVVEVIGAVISGSLALLADAGHVLTDIAALLIAIAALAAASRPVTARRTFGLQRLEILAAAVNSLLLFAVAAWVIFEAWQRWRDTPEIDGPAMLVFAVVGLIANVVGMLLLRSAAQTSVNVKGAYLEMWGDLLGSVAVIVAAIGIAISGWARLDPLASVLIALMILPRAWGLLRESTDVLLEATPRSMDLDEVREHWMSKDFVIAVHDMHAWTITSGLDVMSAHVVVRTQVLEGRGIAPLLNDLEACLDGHFNVEHSTIQIEPEGFDETERHIHP
jgi:cobalt-zinc-cadmium efflux system protein